MLLYVEMEDVRRLDVARPKPPRKSAAGRPMKGREAKTLKAVKPWAAEGFSRSEWYRRKAKAK